MDRLIRFFVTRHLLVNIIVLAAVVLGWFFIKDVPREYIPSVASPTLWITARLPGASAADIETKLTIPIEEAIEEVDGIDEFQSVISDHTSFTTVELYLDFSEAQIAKIKQQLRDAIDGITDFPPEMEDTPTIEQFDPDKRPIIEVAMAGPANLLIPAAQRLERQIKRLNLVSRVTLVGLQDPEVRVLVDPVKAGEHGITLLDVVQAVQRRNVSSTGGVFETAADRKQVIVWSRFENPMDVGTTILKSVQGVGTVRISDIARMESTREDTGLLIHTNAEPGISMVIRKRQNADIIDAVDAVRGVMEQAELPEGVTYVLVNDASFVTRNRLALMRNNGLMGAALVALVLFCFMRAQPALWVVAGIPVVFMGALALFAGTGITINLMSLTGFVIVLGMVVDDAVVVAERIAYWRTRIDSAVEAAVKGATEMSKPVAAAALTTVLAFLPMTAIGGLPGKIMWQIPAVVVLVLIFSLFESFCILPAHLTSLRSSAQAEKRPFVQRLEKRYERVLRLALHHRIIVVAVAAAIFFGIMVFIRPHVSFVLFPQDDARSLFVKVTAPLGTSLEQTEAYVRNLEQQLATIAGDEVDAVTARIGHQDVQGADKQRGEAENEGLITVIYRDQDRRFTNAEWIQIYQERLQVPGDVTLVFQSEIMGPPTDQAVTIHLLANNDELRRDTAREIANYLRATPGLTEVEVDERPGTPQVDLNLNYEKLALLGLDPRDVAQTLQAAFFGIEASEHRDMLDTTELRVQFDPASRQDLQSLLEAPVRTRDGRLVRLRDVVNPVEISAVSRIFHREGFRSSTIRASFAPDSGHSALAFATHLERDLLPRYAGYPGLEILLGGEAEDTRETTGELGQVAVIVVLGIGVVIWLTLGSLVEAVFVLVVIPFAVAGVILTFFLHGKPLSMTAVMGLIGLCGVVVNAAIVMVDSIHRHVKDSSDEFPEGNTREQVEDRVVEAVVERLRPILVTALTTMGGVFPTAYGLGGYDFIVSPMSIALGWGLMFSTLITLFLVPVLYSFAQDLKRVRFPVGMTQPRSV